MESKIKARIRELLECKHLTAGSLAERGTALQRRVSDQILHERTLSVETLCILWTKIPDVNLEWLLYGTGNMLTDLSLTDKIKQQSEALSRASEKIAQLEEKNALQNKIIELQSTNKSNVC